MTRSERKRLWEEHRGNYKRAFAEVTELDNPYAWAVRYVKVTDHDVFDSSSPYDRVIVIGVAKIPPYDELEDDMGSGAHP